MGPHDDELNEKNLDDPVLLRRKKMFKPKEIAVVAVLTTALLFLVWATAIAHPGNTASDGCHYCRTNCDKWGVPEGQRHCH